MTTNFDYTKVPGPLLYRGKRHLDDFGVEVNPSLNYFIQERLFQRYSTIPTYEDLANDLFNCTYYICTMVLADSHPERRFGAYVEIVHRYLHNFDDYASAALAMILLQMWARRWDMPPHRLKRLADMIKNYLQDNYEKVFREFFYPVTQDMQAAGINKIEYQDEFAPCEINIRLLKDASQYWNWKNEFKKDEDKVWEFVVAIGKTEKEQKYIVEFLREELHSNFENGKEHKYFFENLEYKIHKLHHAAEEKAKLDAEVDAEIERQALEDIENSYARERVLVLEKENAKLREDVEQIRSFLKGAITIDDLNKAIEDLYIGPEDAKRIVADAIAQAENGDISLQQSESKEIEEKSDDNHEERSEDEKDRQILELRCENERLTFENNRIIQENDELRKKLEDRDKEGGTGWIDWLDDIFDDKINAEKVFETISDTSYTELTTHCYWFVVFKVLSEIHWIPKPKISGGRLLKWANAHFEYGWTGVSQFKFDDIDTRLKKTPILKWGEHTMTTNQGIYYRKLADILIEKFVLTLPNGKIRDRDLYLKEPQNKVNHG